MNRADQDGRADAAAPCMDQRLIERSVVVKAAVPEDGYVADFYYNSQVGGLRV